MTCTCGKGDDSPAIVHADSCPCIDWVSGPLEGAWSFGDWPTQDELKELMMAQGIDFNEEKATNEGGQELDEVVEQARKQKERDPDTLANPTELATGGAGEGQGLHSGGSAEN